MWKRPKQNGKKIFKKKTESTQNPQVLGRETIDLGPN